MGWGGWALCDDITVECWSTRRWLLLVVKVGWGGWALCDDFAVEYWSPRRWLVVEVGWGGWALCDDFRLITASGFRVEAKGEERTERAPWLEDALLSILKRPE